MAKSISRYLADISSTSGVLDGTLSTAAQTNITSLGTLSSLTVSGSAAMTLTTAAQPNITSVGTLSSLTVSGAMNGTLSTAAQPNITSVGTLTTLTIDDITINGSTISDAENFEIDSGGNIILDADGGSLFLKDGGTEFGLLQKFSNNFNIKSSVSDGDLVFQGNDGGSAINALILDMSEAGAATFNGEVLIPEKLTHVGDTDTYFKFAGANDIRIVAGGDEHVAFDGTIVFNQAGTDMDFRVESTSNANMLHVDAGNDRVGIGTNAAEKTLHISSAENQPLRVESTDAYAGVELKDSGSATLPPLVSALSNDIIFYGGHASTRPEIMRLRSDGNVGIGAAGMATASDFVQLSIGAQGHIMARDSEGTSRSLHISQNAHYDADASWETMQTDEATNYYQQDGQHVFRTASSTSAGTDITWTTSMQITKSRIRTPHISIGNLSSNSYDYQGSSPAAGFQIFSFTCTADNTFRTVLSGFNNTAFEFTTAVGDAASKDNASYSGVLTSPAYGVSAMNQNYYHNNGWNTGSFAYQFVNNGTADYYLQVKMTSYYNSSNTATGYIFLRRLY